MSPFYFPLFISPAEALSRFRVCIGDEFPAVGKAGFEMPFLVLVHVVMLDDMIVGGQQEAAGAAGGVADGIFGSRIDTIDDPKDQFAGRVSGKALAAGIQAQRTDG